MRQIDPPRRESPRRWMAYPHWPLISIVVCVVLLAVVLTAFSTKLRALDVFSAFLLFGAAVLSILIVLYTRSLRRAQQVQLDTEERLQQMADNIQEIFWMIDAETKKVLSVTAAYETITGRSCQSLLENPSSYEKLIHPEDRLHVLAKLGEATQTGHFDERFRIVRPRGEVRWVTVHGFPVRDAAGKIHRLVGTVREITAQKEAEEKVAEHLATAESARAESDARPRTVCCLPTPNTRRNGPASRAIPTSDHGFAFRWLRPSRPWGCFRWATPSQTPSHKTTSGERNYWGSPPRRRSRILVSTSVLRSMVPNFSAV